jgi:transposase
MARSAHSVSSGSRSVRAARWEALVASWRRSGESQAAFCRRRRLSVERFSWWKRRLAAIPAGGNRSRFVAVRVRSSGPAEVPTGVLEITLAGGTRIRVERDCPGELLVRVLGAFGGQGC